MREPSDASAGRDGDVGREDAARAGDASASAPRWWRSSPATNVQSRAVERLVVRSAVLVALVALATVVAALLLWRLRLLVLLLLVAVFVAVLLNPAVRALTRRGMSRGAATGAVYLVGVATAVALLYLLVHPVYGSATRFAKELPNLVSQAQHGRGPVGRLAARLHLLSFVKSHAPKLESVITKLSKPALSVGKTVVSGLVGTVTIVVVSFFLLLEAPQIFAGVLRWMRPERAALTRRIADDMARQVTGFMVGNLATSVIAGVVVYASLQITGVPFAGVLAIWVGLVDFLPLVGGLLAGVPAVGLAFLHSLPAGIVTVIVFVVYQQVENHVLYPVVISRTVSLNPLWVLLAVLVGAEVGSVVGSTFGGLCGALLAVPAAGAVQVGGRVLLDGRAGGAGVRAPRGE
ncbi:MAG TPA: AI-2E family transporter [Acidimicrobiales bacterium]|nr:AI-2E family transporter [Acidimicrobiales bacterium]